MAQPLTDEQFIAVWQQCKGSPVLVSRALGITERAVYLRRAALAEKGLVLSTIPSVKRGNNVWKADDEGRAYARQIDLSLDTGHVIVFSDAHWWPNQPKTLANEAMLILIEELKPIAVINNGDAFDGARVSRHAPLGWSKLPSVREELEIVEDRLAEIEERLPKGCHKIWNVGNHDARLDRALVQNAPEFEGAVQRLEDRFDRWDFAWSTKINGNVMVKHRYHNGIHATYNNTLKAGLSIVTGHLHRLAVTPWGDYNGRRYGVDTGTLSDPLAPQFDYAENNPSPHTSGFAVLKFVDGKLLPPELCEVIDNKAYFRGELVISESDLDDERD